MSATVLVNSSLSKEDPVHKKRHLIFLYVRSPAIILFHPSIRMTRLVVQPTTAVYLARHHSHTRLDLSLHHRNYFDKLSARIPILRTREP